MKNNFLFSIIIVVVLSLMLVACGTNSTDNNQNTNDNSEETENVELGQEEISVPYVTWASTTAAVNVLKPVLEELGYEVNLNEVEAGAMFTSIADGSSDVSFATLPNTQEDYWDEYGDEIDDVGKSMPESTVLGLVVPEYMDIDSLEDLTDNTNDIGDRVNWTITGIDPGAGQMQLTEEKVMPGYDLDNDWKLKSSSDSAMAAALGSAIEDEEPIVVTLWEPHWAFIEWDLKFLEDPEGLYGEADDRHVIARKGLEEDAPAAYKMLSQFEWTPEDMAEVMMDTHEGMAEDEAGEKWVEENRDKVDEWMEGIEVVD